jgi:hypothetical protein
MGGAKAMSLRLQIIEERQAGKTLSELCTEHKMSYATVQSLCARYAQMGIEGLKSKYANCGQRRRDGRRDLVYRAVRCFKTWHPKWGAEKIRAELLMLGPNLEVPPARTLQQWFVYNGQNRRCNKAPQGERQWAKAVHEVWQVDAKEEMLTLDGHKNCWLNITDEHSGGIIKPKVFPPQKNLRSGTGTSTTSTA